MFGLYVIYTHYSEIGTISKKNILNPNNTTLAFSYLLLVIYFVYYYLLLHNTQPKLSGLRHSMKHTECQEFRQGTKEWLVSAL